MDPGSPHYPENHPPSHRALTIPSSTHHPKEHPALWELPIWVPPGEQGQAPPSPAQEEAAPGGLLTKGGLDWGSSTSGCRGSPRGRHRGVGRCRGGSGSPLGSPPRRSPPGQPAGHSCRGSPRRAGTRGTAVPPGSPPLHQHRAQHRRAGGLRCGAGVWGRAGAGTHPGTPECCRSGSPGPALGTSAAGTAAGAAARPLHTRRCRAPTGTTRPTGTVCPTALLRAQGESGMARGALASPAVGALAGDAPVPTSMPTPREHGKRGPGGSALPPWHHMALHCTAWHHTVPHRTVWHHITQHSVTL